MNGWMVFVWLIGALIGFGAVIQIEGKEHNFFDLSILFVLAVIAWPVTIGKLIVLRAME